MVTRKSIERGETIAAPLKETAVFPPMVTQMIGVGEATGALDTMLSKIADFYEEEVDVAVAGLLTLMEPIMIADPGRHRRRHRHFDVSADLRFDQQTGVDDRVRVCGVGSPGSSAIRAVVSTLLLGSATVARITSRGSFAVDPLFFLIGLTYALTIVYALTLRFVDTRRWLVDLQLAVDALVVSALIYFTGGITSVFASLYVLPVVAASTLQFRRGGLMVATLSAVLYVGIVARAVPECLRDPDVALAGRAGLSSCRRDRWRSTWWRSTCSGSLPWPCFQRVARGQPPVGRCAPGAGVERDRRASGPQSVRRRQPAKRPGDDGLRAAHSVVQPRGDGDHGRDVRGGRRPPDWRGAAAATRTGGRPERRDQPVREALRGPLPHARQAGRARDRLQCDASGDSGRASGAALHLPGRDRHQEARARRRDSAAVGGGG